MKPKSARRFLTRNTYKIIKVKVIEGRSKAFKIVKPYLKVLKTDLNNKASQRVYEYFSRL